MTCRLIRTETESEPLCRVCLHIVLSETWVIVSTPATLIRPENLAPVSYDWLPLHRATEPQLFLLIFWSISFKKTSPVFIKYWKKRNTTKFIFTATANIFLSIPWRQGGGARSSGWHQAFGCTTRHYARGNAAEENPLINSKKAILVKYTW